MLQITLDVFSGRENPSSLVEGQEARELIVELSRNRGILTDLDAGYQGLGFRGVIIEPTTDTVSRRHDLPPIFKIAGGSSGDEAKAQEIAERLIRQVIQGGPRDRIALPASFEKTLLDMLSSTAAGEFDSEGDSPAPAAAAPRCAVTSNSVCSTPIFGTTPTTSGATTVTTTRPTSERTPWRNLAEAQATSTRRSPARP